MLSESHLFETEIGMYCHALPEFERILREAGDNTKLFVPCIYHSLKPRQVMIFEDLVPQGYTVIRDSPPSLGDLKLAFDKLAKWHAVSMKVINEVGFIGCVTNILFTSFFPLATILPKGISVWLIRNAHNRY